MVCSSLLFERNSKRTFAGAARMVRERPDKLPPPPMLCHSCGKKVYPLDFLSVDSNIYHKQCFKCGVCNRMLTVGNYAGLKEKVFCKPHFTQVFKEKGNLSGFEELIPTVSSSVPPSPAPSDAPAGENHHADHSPRPTPPKQTMSTRRPEDFQSGFEPEYVPSTISKLQTDKCGKCQKKVFAIGKIDVDGSPWHLNCFRCAICSCQLDLEMYKAGAKKEAVYCFKHAPK